MKNRSRNVMRFSYRTLSITLLFLALFSALPQHALAQTRTREECYAIYGEALKEVDRFQTISLRRGFLTGKSGGGDADTKAELERKTQESRLSRNKIERLLTQLLDECGCPKGTGKTEETPGTPAEKPGRDEVAGGFSLIREDSDPESFNTYGFDASYTRYLNERVGFTGDFSGNFRERNGAELSKYSLLGGLTLLPFEYADADDRVRVFLRGLAGVSHFKADFGTGSFTDNSFTAKLGGGVDIDVTKNFFIRPFEASYNPIFGDSTQHNVQFIFGAGVRWK